MIKRDRRAADGPQPGMTRAQLVARVQELEARVARESDERFQLEVQNLELRASQMHLAKSNTRLTDLFEFAPTGYLTVNPAGHITAANLTAAALLRIGRGLLIGRSVITFVASADRRVLRQQIDRCMSQRIRVEKLLPLTAADGETIAAQVTCVPALTEETVDGCLLALTDITALKRAQDNLRLLAEAGSALASSFDYRSTLAEVTRLAVPALGDICIVDLTQEGGSLERVNVTFADPEMAQRVAQLRKHAPVPHPTNPIGQVMLRRAPLLVENVEHDLLLKVARASSVILAPIVVRDKLFGLITLAVTNGPRRYTDDALATAHDLAARAALAIDNAHLYEKAQEAICSRESMLSFVSHDLRNPLMGIELTVEGVLRSPPPGGERRKGWKQLERIRRGVQQMRRMIGDLLDVTSLDSGHLRVSPAPCHVGDLFDDSFGLMSPVAAARQITLHFRVRDQALQVRCDRERVLQVLSNLIDNAIKFTPPGGAITVLARQVDAQAVLSVSDTGQGIPADQRAHVFQRFWQADETARKGNGLGLFIAKGLVEAHGGTIWVEDAPGPGATFSFSLPLASTSGVASLPSTMSPARESLDRGLIGGAA